MQMRILQAVSGYVADEEEDSAAQGGSGAAEAASGAMPGLPAVGGAAGRGTVEAALVSKARRLEHQLTTLRLELAEAKGGRSSFAACLVVPWRACCGSLWDRCAASCHGHKHWPASLAGAWLSPP